MSNRSGMRTSSENNDLADDTQPRQLDLQARLQKWNVQLTAWWREKTLKLYRSSVSLSICWHVYSTLWRSGVRRPSSHGVRCRICLCNHIEKRLTCTMLPWVSARSSACHKSVAAPTYTNICTEALTLRFNIMVNSMTWKNSKDYICTHTKVHVKQHLCIRPDWSWRTSSESQHRNGKDSPGSVDHCMQICILYVCLGLDWESDMCWYRKRYNFLVLNIRSEMHLSMAPKQWGWHSTCIL